MTSHFIVISSALVLVLLSIGNLKYGWFVNKFFALVVSVTILICAYDISVLNEIIEFGALPNAIIMLATWYILSKRIPKSDARLIAFKNQFKSLAFEYKEAFRQRQIKVILKPFCIIFLVLVIMAFSIIIFVRLKDASLI